MKKTAGFPAAFFLANINKNKMSHKIHDNPELSYHEYQSSKLLADYLEKEGFQVERGLYGLETSFRAEYDSGKPGKTICFMAEYDALPNIGHACGHNIIATNSCGSGVILKRTIEEFGLPGKVVVLGTPAEENGSGKIQEIEKGAFKNIDHAIIMHPTDNSIPDDISFAAVTRKYVFHGKAAHAAAFPWVGRSALNGVIQMFNGVDANRLQLKDYSRVHGIITEGGATHNQIPEVASCLFNLRALDYKYLNEIIDMVDRCAKGAATMTGCEVEIEEQGEMIKNVKNDPKIVNFVRKNMEEVGEKYVERSLDQGIGSTDAGNVTHEISAAQYYIRLDYGIGTHTTEFEEAAGDERGERCLSQALKVTSMTALDLLLS